MREIHDDNESYLVVEHVHVEMRQAVVGSENVVYGQALIPFDV